MTSSAPKLDAAWHGRMADGWIANAADHEAEASDIAALEQEALDPSGGTRETILRRMRAFTATDRLVPRGGGATITITIDGYERGADITGAGATSIDALGDLVRRVAAWHRVQAETCRRFARDCAENARELDESTAA
jgi:hypothetical protein